MTFQSSYAKLLADPTYGQIGKRKEHAREMYLAGLQRVREIYQEHAHITDAYEFMDVISNEIQAIAEESK